MKKLTLLTGALVLALAVAGGFTNPQAAWAVCFCNANTPYSQTPIFWGKGTDCISATDNLRSNTAAAAYQSCGSTSQTCLGDLIITWGCGYIGSGGYYQINGYQLYKCKECTDINPRDPITP